MKSRIEEYTPFRVVSEYGTSHTDSWCGHCGPHRLQHLLSCAVWDDQHLAEIASAWAAGHLDDGDAVLIVDETADEKSSADCAGVARLGDYLAEVLLLDQGTDAARARAELGWSPSHPSLVDEFRHGSYRK